LFVAAGALAAVTNDTVKYEPKREVLPKAIQFLESLRQNITVNDDVADLIALITEGTCKAHLVQLTGEGSSQETRVSSSINNPNGILLAASYVQTQMEGYGFTVEQNRWDQNRGPNVISTLLGGTKPDEIVVLGAHLDDIPSTGRAPGANDDGSGSTALLCMAQAIWQYREQHPGFKLSRTLALEHYTGEEQGLLGSRAWSTVRARRGDNVVAMIQTDMTAVRLASDTLGLAFVDDARTTDPTLTRAVQDFARTYKDPSLTIYTRVLSGSSCCSDHQSYKENGFPSAGLIEPRGYTGDPQYHRVGDLSSRPEYSVTQLMLSARVMLAAGISIAGPEQN